jgi:ActR/RegA family two-component response regulator
MNKESLQKMDLIMNEPRSKPRPAFKTLVIDANFFFAGSLEEFLENQGHAIQRASSASEALAKARDFQPDLIFLDSELDAVSGLHILPELLMEQPAAAVIVMARNPQIAEAVEAIKRGAADYLARPLDFGKLLQVIEFQKLISARV